MRNCDVPGHEVALLGPWQKAETATNVAMVDACSGGGGVRFSATGISQFPAHAMVGALALVKPRTGPQGEIKLVKAVLWYAARLGGSGSPLNFSSLDFHADNTTILRGVTNGPPGAENLVLEQVFDPAETYAYKAFVLCGPITETAPAPGDPDCAAADPTPLLIRGMEVTLREDSQPIVSQPAGSLLAGGQQAGIRTVTYSASDPQSGVAKVEILLDDSVVATRDLTAQCSNSDFTVCPPADANTLDSRHARRRERAASIDAPRAGRRSEHAPR